MPSRAFYKLVLGAFVLTLVVVVLGAWVRLTDAGLGCPDWPGCYGALTVPEHAVDAGKAWREMIHRYAAGLLGLLVLAFTVIAFRRRREPGHPFKLPLAIAAVIIFQALLGMWTVTLLLKPVIVMGHLLGGLTVLALIWLLLLRSGGHLRTALPAPAGLRKVAAAALVIVAVQIALGGWTSANYAAVACPDFPTCQTEWWPDMDFGEGFVIWRGLGTNYEGGVLDLDARTAIHLTHRIGAVITFIFVAALALALMVAGRERVFRRLGATIGIALALQVSLGILTVVLGFPLAAAVAHNAGAAFLLLTLVALNHAAR
ncbi:MAG: COX15/CtaA family protein [Gammaproteobacteria bacterium]